MKKYKLLEIAGRGPLHIWCTDSDTLEWIATEAAKLTVSDTTYRAQRGESQFFDKRFCLIISGSVTTVGEGLKWQSMKQRCEKRWEPVA